MHLVLASSSPRRAELLKAAGFSFTIRPADADESPRTDESPDEYVQRVALAKSMAAGAPPADTVVLAADTIVVIDGLRLGKPTDDRDAADMLARLSGRTHEVLTAIVVSTSAEQPVMPERTVRTVDVARTAVTFNVLPPHVIDWYVASGEPRDKAGAYAIQGLASRFVERLDGSYTNVVGLPVDLVYRHLLALDPTFALGGAPA